MPLANVTGIVSSFLVELSDRREIFIERDAIAPGTGLSGVETCLKARSGWPADRLAGNRSIDVRTAIGESIKVWREIQWVAMRAAGVPTLLIRKKDDDVWLLFSTH